MAKSILAIDIGGSSVKSCILSCNPESFEINIRYPAVKLPSNDFSDLNEIVCELVSKALMDVTDISAIGISTTGSVDNQGTVVSAGHFNGYVNVSWKEVLMSAHNSIEEVVVLNDGRASAWAEYEANAEKVSSHVHVVVGTGVGGGLIYKDELLQGDSGQAGYIGHLKISSGKTAVCSCGNMGCVEALAAAPAISGHYNSLEKEESSTSFEDVVNLASDNNPNAIQAIELGGYYLGVGLGNAMNVLNPSQVTVGGGVMVASEKVLDKDGQEVYFSAISKGIKFAAHKRVFAAIKFRKARYGNDGGMIGAALLTYRKIS